MIKNYQNESEDVILNHGRNAIGETFQDLIIEKDEKVNELIKTYRTNKGFIGNLFQYAYYGVYPNSKKEPDFEKAGIELKVAAYKKNKDGSLSADQRLVLSTIDFQKYTEDMIFEKSTLMNKCNRMLMFYYYLDDNINERINCRIDYMFDYKMLSIPKEDLKIIKSDYYKIVNKIKSGNACDISETDTVLLSACRRDGKEVVYKIGDNNYSALPRRFAFKNSYISYLLNEYISCGKSCDMPKKKKSKIRDVKLPRGKTFEEFVEKTLNQYVGKYARKIAVRKKVDYQSFVSSNDYNKFYYLSCKMLGVNSNSAPFLKKASITIKAIRISKNNYIEQSVSFPPFKFKEIVDETNWIESRTYEYLSERKFLFFVFKENEIGEFVFLGYKFYSLSSYELDTYFEPVWKKTKNLLANGFDLKKKHIKGKEIYENPLPGMLENGVCHIRPHSKKSAYKLKDGICIGNVENDANEMPDGQWMTTQSFWINNTYVMKILKEYVD